MGNTAAKDTVWACYGLRHGRAVWSAVALDTASEQEYWRELLRQEGCGPHEADFLWANARRYHAEVRDEFEAWRRWRAR